MTSTMPTAANARGNDKLIRGPIVPLDQWRLSVNVMLAADGPVVDREDVTLADLDMPLAEYWFDGYVCRGYPAMTFDQVPLPCLQPLYHADGRNPQACVGYILTSTLPDGRPVTRLYSMLSLGDVAQRPAARLLATGRLQVGATYEYELVATRAGGAPGPATARAASPAAPIITVQKKDPPLTWLVVPRRELEKGAEVHGQPDPRWPGVFYTRAARRQSERFSRQGAKSVPSIETGAALIGTLCLCPETSAISTVITQALQVVGADQTNKSMEYTAESWGRIDGVLGSIQQQAATSTFRLVGQAHGHNFLPDNGAPPCPGCHQQKACTRTSAFVSQEDLTWTRAVFAREPFALAHIYGLTARHLRPDPDEVDGLFGIADGRLGLRPYSVIDEFDPSRWPKG